MTVKAFLLSLEPEALARRYAKLALPGFYACPGMEALPREAAVSQLHVAALGFFGELRGLSPEENPDKTLLTQEISDEDDPEDEPWFTPVITGQKGFAVTMGLPADGVILNRSHYPQALGYILGNRCRDDIGQGATLMSLLAAPGFPGVEEMG